MHTVESLAEILREKRSVSFVFLNSETGSEEVVNVRECDQWDKQDAKAEGIPDWDEDGFTVGYPRHGDIPICTALKFSNRNEAGNTILSRYFDEIR